MEKSRAIELLKLAVPIKALTQQEYSDFVEAVNMGMDALEQPTSLDTIDRKAAINVIEDYPHGNVWNVESMEEMVDKIKALPPAQPEPHEGHWIPVHPIQSDDPGAYMCSKCKTGMWEIRPSSYHYCPNCGAKMKGERQK